MADDFERGLLVGILIGEGHFGGDGRQPHITLRMHVRHAALFDWIVRTFPGGRLYGPYNHGGREYLQWMARGSFLREELVPFLAHHLSRGVDGHSRERFERMCERYAVPIPPTPASLAPRVPSATPTAPDPQGAAAAGAQRALERPHIDEIFHQLRGGEADHPESQ